MKSNTPFGQLPILEVDGKQISQSCAMARYLARQYKLAGKDALEEAYVDSIADYHKDSNSAIGPHFGVIAGRVPGDKVRIFNPTKSVERTSKFKLLCLGCCHQGSFDQNRGTPANLREIVEGERLWILCQERSYLG
jgi:hypothetical protein